MVDPASQTLLPVIERNTKLLAPLIDDLLDVPGARPARAHGTSLSQRMGRPALCAFARSSTDERLSCESSGLP